MLQSNDAYSNDSKADKEFEPNFEEADQSYNKDCHSNLQIPSHALFIVSNQI